jgi:hypothetical protein
MESAACNKAIFSFICFFRTRAISRFRTYLSGKKMIREKQKEHSELFKSDRKEV